MKILFTVDPEIPVPPKLYGGIERIVNDLIIQLRKKGHTIGLLANGASVVEVDFFIAWPGKVSQNQIDTIKNTFSLQKAIKKFQPEVLHSFSRIFYMLPQLLFDKKPKIMSYQRDPSAFTTAWAHRLARGSLTFTGCSEYIANLGKKHGGQWQAIHNFVALEKFTFQSTVGEDAPLVFLSRVESIKGADLAIQAALTTGKKLIIAGNHATEGNEATYWQEKVFPFIDNQQIQYIGSVNDQQKNDLLGKALAMIVPIQWNEPFGIVFAEALACGTPVISCPKGALPEIVRTGQEGFLVNNLEEICQAIEKIQSINRKNCRNRVETFFSSEIIAAQYENLYRHLLEKT